ncbi:MAG: carotenoid biosynthesis protein [Spirochaetes bacterium]|nr:carotenoid biosynthesis protein [Spirochaetota bacterium]
MGQFTVVPIWVLEDLVVYILGAAVLLFIVRREKRPGSIILEMLSFCFLYAAVYENFATLMGWYGYGRSLLMIFNVPFSVPLVEYLVVYSTLRLLDRDGIPGWSKPWIVGLTGMLFDFSLDPIAMRQIFDTAEGKIGRWTWFPGTGDVQIFGEPVYNFSGWILLCGYFTATILAGRAWYRKSGYKSSVGTAYPILCSLAALLILVSPLSQFILWLAPFMKKGSAGEWIMLGVNASVGLVFFFVFAWPAVRKQARREREIPAVLILIVIPIMNFAICLVGGYWDIAWLVGASTIILAGSTAVAIARTALRPTRSGTP